MIRLCRRRDRPLWPSAALNRRSVIDATLIDPRADHIRLCGRQRSGRGKVSAVVGTGDLLEQKASQRVSGDHEPSTRARAAAHGSEPSKRRIQRGERSVTIRALRLQHREDVAGKAERRHARGVRRGAERWARNRLVARDVKGCQCIRICRGG